MECCYCCCGMRHAYATWPAQAGVGHTNGISNVAVSPATWHSRKSSNWALTQKQGRGGQHEGSQADHGVLVAIGPLVRQRADEVGPDDAAACAQRVEEAHAGGPRLAMEQVGRPGPCRACRARLLSGPAVLSEITCRQVGRVCLWVVSSQRLSSHRLLQTMLTTGSATTLCKRKRGRARSCRQGTHQTCTSQQRQRCTARQSPPRRPASEWRRRCTCTCRPAISLHGILQLYVANAITQLPTRVQGSQRQVYTKGGIDSRMDPATLRKLQVYTLSAGPFLCRTKHCCGGSPAKLVADHRCSTTSCACAVWSCASSHVAGK